MKQSTGVTISRGTRRTRERKIARCERTPPKFHLYIVRCSRRRCVCQLVTRECCEIKTIDETRRTRVEFARKSCPSACVCGTDVQFSSRLYRKRSIGYIRDTQVSVFPELLFHQIAHDTSLLSSRSAKCPYNYDDNDDDDVIRS